MRNATNRHVKTNIKNQVKQNTCESKSCYYCAHAQTGYFSDTMRCCLHDSDTPKTNVCDRFERRE